MFGRVAPQQKRAMVAALQAAGHTVAMTGDGVNDVLALKDADVGVAMGSGSAATRSVAQLVLLDDELRRPAAGHRRGPAGDRQRRAGGQPLPDQDRLRHHHRRGGGGDAASPYPFLPRHLTIVSDFSIGIPAFFLSLLPNNRRFKPGFVNRVLGFSLPCGVVAGGGRPASPTTPSPARCR